MSAAPHIDIRLLCYGLGACAAWALGNVANKAVLDRDIAPLTLLMLQLLVSTPSLWLLVIIVKPPFSKTNAWVMMGLGVIQPGLAFGLAILGLQYTTASVESLLFAGETLIILALAWPILCEQPSKSTLLSAVIGGLGVVLISWGQSHGSASANEALGAILILLGVAAAALYGVLLRRFGVESNAMVMIAFSQTGGFAFVLIVWLLWPHADPWQHINLNVLPLIGASGILMHALSFVLFAYVLQKLPVGSASLFLPIIPVMTISLATILLGETLSSLQLIGGSLVLFSTAALAQHKKIGADLD